MLPEKGSNIDTMGGQAVIEGVMMRSPRGVAIAIRKRSSGEIKVKKIPFVSVTKKVKLLGLPFLRGAVALGEMLVMGIKALDYSAREWEEDEQPKEPGQEAKKKEAKKSSTTWSIVLGMLLGLVLAILLMVVVPNLLTSYVGRIGLGDKAPVEEVKEEGELAPSERSRLVEEQSPLVYNLITGFFRAAIIVGYIFFISRLKDIRRIFAYHGAEHKVVAAYEASGEATVEAAKSHSPRHPRCGTSFLAIVILVSIVVFSIIAALVIRLFPAFTTLSFPAKKAILFVLHLLFLPVIAGLSYEVMKFSARRQHLWFFRLLVYPGILFQALTTNEPDEAQLEVAVVSLKSALSVGKGENVN